MDVLRICCENSSFVVRAHCFPFRCACSLLFCRSCVLFPLLCFVLSLFQFSRSFLPVLSFVLFVYKCVGSALGYDSVNKSLTLRNSQAFSNMTNATRTSAKRQRIPNVSPTQQNISASMNSSGMSYRNLCLYLSFPSISQRNFLDSAWNLFIQFLLNPR